MISGYPGPLHSKDLVTPPLGRDCQCPHEESASGTGIDVIARAAIIISL